MILKMVAIECTARKRRLHCCHTVACHSYELRTYNFYSVACEPYAEFSRWYFCISSRRTRLRRYRRLLLRPASYNHPPFFYALLRKIGTTELITLVDQFICYIRGKVFFQERPNGPFIPNLSHFPTAVLKGYKPVFLHKVVGGYLQKSCKLCHTH